MHRALPQGNRVLSRRREDRLQAEYQDRLRAVRPTVDLKAPFSLLSRPRSKRPDETRYSEIERENRHLLERMANIMQSPRGLSFSPQRRSLNRGLRRRELIKITQENHALLKRIREKRSCYDMQRWEREHLQTQGVVRNISEYPYTLQGRRKPPSAPRLPPLESEKQRKLVLKRSVSLGERSFQLEVREQLGAVNITAFDIERPESYSLQLTRTEATQLLGRDKNYKRLLRFLHFQQGSLMLIDKPQKPRKPVYGEEKGNSGVRSTPISGSQPKRRATDKENKWSAGRIRSLSEKRIVKRKKIASSTRALQVKENTPATSKPQETASSVQSEDKYEDSFESEDPLI